MKTFIFFFIFPFIIVSVLSSAGCTEENLEALVKARYADCRFDWGAFSVEELRQRLQNK